MAKMAQIVTYLRHFFCLIIPPGLTGFEPDLTAFPVPFRDSVSVGAQGLGVVHRPPKQELRLTVARPFPCVKDLSGKHQNKELK